ncbi:MAG: DUF2007 domain-containing protein [Ignavibacteria bacterium]|nr:DUF2007 domain-containing protein [Ignavibacteria bacterium]
MLICPECGYEYKNGVIKCPDCDIPLITKKQKDEIDKRYKNWQIVFSASSNIEAEMVKTKLESADIECVILNQKDRSFQLDGDLGIIKVLVPKDSVSEALQIIETFESEEDDLEDDFER